jgi:hypothetical protein
MLGIPGFPRSASTVRVIVVPRLSKLSPMLRNTFACFEIPLVERGSVAVVESRGRLALAEPFPKVSAAPVIL